MKIEGKSIRPFIGCRDFGEARAFYSYLGFEETTLSPDMSVFRSGEFSFYLQDAYVKDWIDNTMIFMEVANVNKFYEELKALDITSKFRDARITPIRIDTWGDECFVHDPSGNLWHFGQFRME